jgi:hypothetical protein
MGRAEAVEPGYQPLGREGRCYRDGELVAALVGPQALARLGQAVEALTQRRNGQLAGIGQQQGSGHTTEQGQADEVFQSLHLMADRRRRDVELPGGLGEAQVPCRGLESAQGIQRGDASAHGDLHIRISKPSQEQRSFVERPDISYLL